MMFKGTCWEWEVLVANDGLEYYIRRRYLSGQHKAKVIGPFSKNDLISLGRAIAEKVGAGH